MSGYDSGYDFTPLPTRVHREERPHAVWDKRVEGCFSGILKLKYELLTALHVGSGFKRLEGGRATRAMTRSGAGLIVPGSSLKGALRARFEAVTKSCVLWRQRDQTGVVSQSHPDVKQAELAKDVAQHDVFRGCQGERTCAACALFGFLAHRSRVGVDDFVPIGDGVHGLEHLPEQHAPRLHHCGDATVEGRHQKQGQGQGLVPTFVVQSLHGRKLYTGTAQAQSAEQRVEVIPIGAQIGGMLRLFNITPAELGGVLLAAGVHPSGGLLRMGAGKAFGMGTLRCVQVELQLVEQQSGGGRNSVVDNARARQDWHGALRRSQDYWGKGEEALLRLSSMEEQ